MSFEEKIGLEIKYSEVMADIVGILDEDKDFVAVTEGILSCICKKLHFQSAVLRQKELKGDKWKILSQYGICDKVYEEEAVVEAFERTYINEKEDVYLPIAINGRVSMHMAFFDALLPEYREEYRTFLETVRLIVQSALAKRIVQNSLAGSYASLEAIIENVGCGIFVYDSLNQKCLYTNEYYRRHFRGNTTNNELENLLQSGCGHTEFFVNENNRWFDIYNSSIQWVDGRKVTLYTIYEVTDKKNYQQKIERQINNDFLTGLYNRMRCEQDLEHFIKQTKEFGGQGALLYIDLDDFKHINDGLGHQYGDALLRSISHSLQRVSGIENTCYRMGGDEFIIIVPHAQFNMLKTILDDICSIFTKPWFLKGADYYCTMSMGVARFPEDGNTVDELIKKADIALYEAKKTGKNRIEYYNDAVESISFKRLDLGKKMRDAARDAGREFEVFFQPIMGVDGCCQGAEALIRWKLDGMGFVSPAEFIPLAEYLGLINPIGEFVLMESCKYLKRWNDMGHPNYQVNVNLSVVQLLQNDIVTKVEKVIREFRICPENLVLEVTESLAVNDMGRMKQILGQIKDLGVRVAMDDFGTGYSSLNHIREMPLDIIKIDRCFVQDIGKDEFSESFVKMVAELAATIGVTVCVEGVEEREQYEVLSRMKIQQIQGFYYDEPMSASQFEEKYVKKQD
ncbi:MAG: EAL domain-containing protein [Lachnospiraceae bacterium]|nr:EAL domain-containing protein [Lachnospiraceae bacterium]